MKKYHMSPLIDKYYKNWVNSDSLFSDIVDLQKFYQFVKACLRYSRSRKDTHWLKFFLDKDLPEKYNKDKCQELVETATFLFNHLLDYEKTPFPNYILEMRNPFSVKYELMRIRNYDGSSYYSIDAIEKILVDNFGTDWEKKWLKKAKSYRWKNCNKE